MKTFFVSLNIIFLAFSCFAGDISVDFSKTAPNPPTNLSATEIEDGTVLLKWTHSTSSYINHYKVYYDIDSGTPYTGSSADQGSSPIWISIYDLPVYSSPSITLTGLQEGIKYFFAVSTINYVSEESILSDEVFVFGSPLNVDVSSSSHPNSSRWYCSREVDLSWTAGGANQGFYYSLDRSTSSLPKPGNGLFTINYNTVVSATDDGTWYFHLRGWDGVSEYGEAEHYKINIDTKPVDIFSTTHPDSNSWYNLTAAEIGWQVDNPDSVTGWYYEVDQDSSTIPTTDSNPLTADVLTKELKDLGDGINYFHIIWQDRVGHISDASPGIFPIRIDTVSPEPVAVLDATTGPSGTVWLTWSFAEDDLGGIGHYDVHRSVREGEVGPVIAEVTSTLNQYNDIDDHLHEGFTYTYTVMPVDKAGNVQETGNASDSITIDYSINLPAPKVIDQGDWLTSGEVLYATWTMDWPEPDDIKDYQYAIGSVTEATSVRSWTSAGLVNSITASELSLSDGVYYFINVRALDMRDNPGKIGTTDGIRIDTSAPLIPDVTGMAEQFNKWEIGAFWNSFDPESGVTNYEYSVYIRDETAGTLVSEINDKVSMFQDWEDVGLETAATVKSASLVESATYYFAVKAENLVGFWSDAGWSDGMSISNNIINGVPELLVFINFWHKNVTEAKYLDGYDFNSDGILDSTDALQLPLYWNPKK